jgi:hypothetical protein
MKDASGNQFHGQKSPKKHTLAKAAHRQHFQLVVRNENTLNEEC